MEELSIKRGADSTIELIFSDEQGNPSDINRATIWFTVRKRVVCSKIKDDTDAAIPQKKFENVEGNTTGILNVDLTAEETDIECGTYYADAKMLKNGKYTLSDIFKLIVEETVTRVK